MNDKERREALDILFKLECKINDLRRYIIDNEVPTRDLIIISLKTATMYNDLMSFNDELRESIDVLEQEE